MGGGHLHIIVDVTGSAVQRAPEDPWEGQDVVDLVGEIGAACSHDFHACGHGLVVHDLRRRVRHGKNDGILGHGLYHLRL